MMTLPQLKRLRKEYDDLEIKQNKLTEFTQSEKFDALEAVDQHLLVRQLFAMECYSSMLELRIELEETRRENTTS